MGSYCYLEIIENNRKKILDVDEWKYTIPEKNGIFDFIFHKSDFIKKKKFWFYQAKVLDVLERLKLLNLDEERILLDISNFLGVSIKDAKIALLIDEPPDELRESFKRFSLENHINLWNGDDNEEITDEYNKYLMMAEKLNSINVNHLKTLYYYGCILKKYKKQNYYLRLNFKEIIDLGIDADTCNELITQEQDQRIEINKEYLFTAKKHFSEHHYDLVYIELIIILERALKQYLASKKATNNFSAEDIKKLCADLSLMTLLKFSLYYLKSSNITIDEFKQIENIYNTRNNVIHANQKRFSRFECAKAIRVVEKLLTELKC